MKKLLAIMTAIGCFTAGAHAIGDQHGLFRSQSTQGAAWQGTATIVEEQYNITVYADYLDVELDWVFQVGGSEPDSFKNALEIVGNLNLVDKSVVTGMITWYNGMVLKGKIKTNDVARAQYEDVVQRDSDIPPPPRDPVLLEWIRDDNYDISIFPVAFGQTRHVRIRYLIPAFLVNGENKISYPHAFTDNAKVSIRKGDGVRGYRVESYASKNLFENRDFLALSSAEYSFKAYGGSNTGRISYIIPVLSLKEQGSRFYAGDFATPSFSGQMVHVTVMSGEEALQYAGLPEDYVILWRWNHPDILAKYARQIVAQSALLQEFLTGLDASNKRAALVIDKEGGERVIFRLDVKGSAEYLRMMAYLARLSEQAVVDPPARTTPRGNIDFDVNKAALEFRDALKAAMEQFDKGSAALKHLLILCAGPKLVSGYASDQSAAWDSTINVSLLTSYFHSSGQSAADLGRSSYWPGVNLDMFLTKYKGDLRVCALVGNGADTHSIEVTAPPEGNAYCQQTGTRQMHLYSRGPLKREIKWSVRQGDRVLSEFTEKPDVIAMSENMPYARLIGASVHLFPLAQQMPSSMASCLGFVDDKYSLVALEEDALPPAEAALYRDAGVPLLEPGDIFAASDERFDVPVAEWLAANPPEPMSESVCGWFGDGRMMMIEDMVFFAFAGAAVNVGDPVPARIATPQAMIIYAADPEAYIDYDAPIAAEPAARLAPNTSSITCFVTGGYLVVDLAAFSPIERERMNVALYDLSGRLVRGWGDNQVKISPSARWDISSVVSGLYVVSIRMGDVRVSKKVMVVR